MPEGNEVLQSHVPYRMRYGLIDTLIHVEQIWDDRELIPRGIKHHWRAGAHIRCCGLFVQQQIECCVERALRDWVVGVQDLDEFDDHNSWRGERESSHRPEHQGAKYFSRVHRRTLAARVVRLHLAVAMLHSTRAEKQWDGVRFQPCGQGLASDRCHSEGYGRPADIAVWTKRPDW